MGGAVMTDTMKERAWAVPFLVDVRLTLAVQGRGRGDPTFRADEAGAIWRTSLTPDGPATIRVLPAPSPATRVRAQAWGPGAQWLLDALPGALVRDSIVGRDAVIAGGASVHGVVIGDEAYVGPGNELAKGLRLWPGTRLEATSIRFSSDT